MITTVEKSREPTKCAQNNDSVFKGSVWSAIRRSFFCLRKLFMCVSSEAMDIFPNNVHKNLKHTAEKLEKLHILCASDRLLKGRFLIFMKLREKFELKLLFHFKPFSNNLDLSMIFLRSSAVEGESNIACVNQDIKLKDIKPSFWRILDNFGYFVTNLCTFCCPICRPE